MLRLRYERERRGWSRSYVAEQVGADYNSVARWERGNVSPTPQLRQQLCQLFGMTAYELGFISETSSKVMSVPDALSEGSPSETKATPIPNYKLKHERERRGWSRSYVAEQVGADYNSVARWERGNVSPTPQLRQRLCQLFGMTAQELGFISETSSKVMSVPDALSEGSLSETKATPIPNYKLKHERERRGWSRSYVAEQVGADYNSVARWERGNVSSTPQLRQRLCQLFDMTAQELGLIQSISAQDNLGNLYQHHAVNYGKRLRDLRQHMMWTQIELATKVGTTTRTVIRWERGEVIPELHFQQCLCELFGKDPEELGFIQEVIELTETLELLQNHDRTPNSKLLRQRRIRGWTQRDVAQKISTYPVNISRWECGDLVPDQSFQQRLCELFQCSYEEIGLSQY